VTKHPRRSPGARRGELERTSKFTVRTQQLIATTDTSSRRSTGMFCHLVFTILNHVTKHPTPSLDKHSATELKVCGLVKFWILRKKPCFVLTNCMFKIEQKKAPAVEPAPVYLQGLTEDSNKTATVKHIHVVIKEDLEPS